LSVSGGDSRDQIIEDVVRRVVAELAAGESVPPCSMTGKIGICSSCGNCPANREATVREIIQNGACRVSAGACATRIAPDLAGNIDHTLLKPDATEEAVGKLCREALEHCFASVCVNPCHVEYCARLLRGSSVEVCTVVGFPLGATTSAVKAYEAAEAVRRGATEIDMVINIGYLKGGQYSRVMEDIRAVVQAAEGKCVKVIIEAALLTDEEKVAACALAREAGADFVKTSTGFASGGATVEDVALMRRVVGAEMGVKAAGGIRDAETAEAMLRAGANRIGASASVKIIGAKAAQGDVSRVSTGFTG